MSTVSKTSKLYLLLGFACLLLHGLQVHCSSDEGSSDRKKLEKISETALHFLNTEKSQKLASREEKLDVDQVKELLEAIKHSPSDEAFITRERAAEMIEAGQVERNPCKDDTFERLFRLTRELSPFPNLHNYMDHCRLEQFRKCPEYIEKGKTGYRFRLSKEDLRKLGVEEPRPAPAQPQPESQPQFRPANQVSDKVSDAVKPASGKDGSSSWKSRLVPRCFHDA